MITGIRSIKNATKTAVTIVRSDVPRLGSADHLVLRAGGSEPCDWNVPWSDEKLAVMMADDPTSNKGRGIKIIFGSDIWVIWQEVRRDVDALWIIKSGSSTVSETTPRNAPGGTVRLEIDEMGPSVKDA